MGKNIIYTHTCIYVYIYVHIYTRVHIYAYMYIYVYTYTKGLVLSVVSGIHWGPWNISSVDKGKVLYSEVCQSVCSTLKIEDIETPQSLLDLVCL